jgi:hypothetical protein
MLAVQPGEYTIVHDYDEALTGSTLDLHQSHMIAETLLDYHRDEIAVTSLG